MMELSNFSIKYITIFNFVTVLLVMGCLIFSPTATCNLELEIEITNPVDDSILTNKTINITGKTENSALWAQCSQEDFDGGIKDKVVVEDGKIILSGAGKFNGCGVADNNVDSITYTIDLTGSGGRTVEFWTKWDAIPIDYRAMMTFRETGLIVGIISYSNVTNSIVFWLQNIYWRSSRLVGCR
ncbi:MAG: hypothetical protein AB1779_06110 [Candidatus Thermoplasmatota archaeon]